MKRKIYRVKVFTKDVRAGNLAGVVLEADGLTVKEMAVIARKVGASETAFIFHKPGRAYSIRWFTPNTEVELCVHATIAAAAVLKQKGEWRGRGVAFASAAGTLKLSSENGKIFVRVSGYKVIKRLVSQGLVARYLVIAKDDISSPLKIVSIGRDRELMVQVSGLKVLGALRPNKTRYARLCRILAITGISIFTKQTFGKSSDLHTREFAPLYGYLEDPLCGMAAGAILTYLRSRGGSRQPSAINVEQGHFVKSPGVINVTAVAKSVLIGGRYALLR